jgi:nitroimidazol reductase NimA-like FMN-containing flavoprotein (pyridoxamine 5'-phosphate oxidase superfamily)
VDFADGALYGYSPMGQKIDWMRVNPLVCLEIEEFDAQVGWATLLVFGQYEELPDIPEFAPARHLAERLFQRHPVWWEPASVPIAGQPRRRPVLFRILITRLTGRRGVRTPEGGDRPGDQIAANDPSNGWLKRAVRRLSKR